MRKLVRLVAVSVFLLAAAARADVKLPSVFGDHMVIQQGVEWNIWGAASPGESVTVTAGEAKQSASAGQDGKWKIKMPALPAGGPITISVAGSNTINIQDVLVGEVWFASGQSNMAMKVRMAKDSKEESAAATDGSIRMFTAAITFAPRPADDVKGQWVVCSPESVLDFSATAYYFARDLRNELKVPVGIVHSSWGGKRIEYFLNPATVAKDPSCAWIVEMWQPIAKMSKSIAAKRAASQPTDGKPRRAPNPFIDLGEIYNGMIAPLVPYTIKGAIWYQGEANAGNAFQYRKLMPEMIRQWRGDWRQGDFPFLIVQLANYAPTAAIEEQNFWPDLREAQAMTLKSSPNTGMAVTIDIGDKGDIHPKNKQDVGHRLALAARAIAYGQKIAYSSPVYESMKIEDGKIRLRFAHADGGLKAKEGELRGFAVAGEDQKFVPAQAVIDNDTVVVSSPDVPAPKAVAYGWSQNPLCNLYSGEGLPASPFRTDDWPRKTQSR